MQLQTGNLFVSVTDTSGNALPGVTLTLTGSGAPLVTVTDALGQGRFMDVMPGAYTLKGELEGFATAQKPVEINLGRTTETGLVLQAAIHEVILVPE